MANNNNLHNARKNKNDEFYTQISDIENELKHYKEHFKDKTIFCNCDDPEYSNFWKYYSGCFDHLGLKRLLATHFEDSKQSYMLEMWRDENGTHSDIRTLKQNGDFRSPECIELLQQADIVVTNPPFSLFREYIEQLMEYHKKFIIIGNQNAIAYKEVFPLIKGNSIWWGYNCVRWFMVNDDYEKPTKIGLEGKRIAEGARSRWFTNLDHNKRHETLLLYKSYNPIEFPQYDNYYAINVNETDDIPTDYKGVIGVPITFMDRYCPEQFELLGFTNSGEKNEGIRHSNSAHGRAILNGKEVYTRLLVKYTEEWIANHSEIEWKE